LALWYQIEAANGAVQLKEGQKLQDFVTRIQATTPLGKPDEWGQRGEGIYWWTDVSPDWGSFPVEFEFLDPSTPPEGQGRFQEVLSFSDVPIPQVNQRIGFSHRESKTGRGTYVALTQVERVAPKSAAPGAATTTPENPNGLYKRPPGAVVLTFRIHPPATVADLQVSGHLNPGSVVDDKGTDLTEWKMPAAPKGEAPFFRLRHRLPNGVAAETVGIPAARLVRFTLPSLPQPGAKTMDIKLSMAESASSLRQEKWYRKFHFDLAPNQLPFASNPFEPVRIWESAALKVAVESVIPNSNHHYSLRLWTHDKTVPPANRTKWIVTGYSTRDAKGQLHPHYSDGDPGIDFRWKLDGTPIGDNENGVVVGVYDFDKLGKPMPLLIQLHQRRYVRHRLEFRPLLMPQPGQNIQVNATADEGRAKGDGPRLVLREVGHFNKQNLLPGTTKSNQMRAEQAEIVSQYGAGVRLAFEILPAASRKSFLSFIENLNEIAVMDERGHLLDEQSIGPANDEQRYPKGKWFTVFLVAPTQATKTLTCTMLMDEVFETGKKANVEILALPLKPQMKLRN
jgi:hypothetical protein